MELKDIIDLDRYPLTEPSSPQLDAAIKTVRANLKGDGCAVIKGFVRPEAVEVMAQESKALQDQGHFNELEVTAYPPFKLSDRADWPADHPRSWSKLRQNRFVPYDLIAATSPLRSLYESRALTNFIRLCTGKEALYLYGDPLGACALSVQHEGEELPWHFDVTHFVVSLLLQKPLKGGDFEYAPYIKSEVDEQYDDVAQVLAGTGKTVTLDLQPGDLQLFEGRYSMHRVTAPEGPVSRSIALLSYGDHPGVIGKPDMQMKQYGRSDQTPLIRDDAASIAEVV